jgi:hypothetical protein
MAEVKMHTGFYVRNIRKDTTSGPNNLWEDNIKMGRK